MDVLGPRRRRAIGALAEAILPGGPAAVDVAARLEEFLRDAGRVPARRFRWLLRLFEHGARFSRGLRPFSRLPAARRAAYVRRWAQSRVAARRFAFQALAAAVTFAYASDPAVERALGYVYPRARGPASDRRPG